MAILAFTKALASAIAGAELSDACYVLQKVEPVCNELCFLRFISTGLWPLS